ncbi:MAG: hypothetical protein MN733_38205, partial [Nitrososphaera sp.]|nr:hypothetical protein [Nitrososphaera sp.]
MNTFQKTQEVLDNLLPVPVNLPKIYLLGDTGAGKTTIIRQLLGTTKLRFPSVRRTRCTIAVTEYVISKEPSYRAVIVFKTLEEITRYVREILEDTITKGYRAFRAQKLEDDELVTNLEESPDQRFRLKFILDEKHRREIAQELSKHFIPKLVSWIESNFPNEQDEIDVIIDLAIDTELRSEVKVFEDKIIGAISNRVAETCSSHSTQPMIEHFEITESDFETFVKRLKPLLDVDDGSISPIIERARIRGNMSASWLPSDIEIVLIDGEGIGHDVKESNQDTLSSRHLDYFYISDAIMLVEDSERPFIAGGKSALVSLIRNGYLPKFMLAFSKLDKVEGERSQQIQEVKRGLRNLLSALSQEHNLSISQDALDIYYLAKMDSDEPHKESKDEITRLLNRIREESIKVKPKSVRPAYDFELLAPFLDKATTEFRFIWGKYLSSHDASRRPWQTVKAFNYRMAWGQDDYKDMRPVANLHTEIITKLEKFIISPTMWEQEVTSVLQQVSLDRFKQEFSNRLVKLI